jgi:hypothetical protein
MLHNRAEYVPWNTIHHRVLVLGGNDMPPAGCPALITTYILLFRPLSLERALALEQQRVRTT